MQITHAVKKILRNYEGETPGVRLNLARFLMHGKLGGSGKMMLLAVDQGMEHGPRTFVMTPDAFDPHYHYQFAVDAELSGYAAPLGWLEAGCESYLGALPLILKINNGNTLLNKRTPPNQAVTATVQDALRLGCQGIGFTIYPGSDVSLEMFEEIRELAAEARSCGLVVVIWSYPRGNFSKVGETALDVVAYGAHIACQLGAHIVKVKLPSEHLEVEASQALYETHIMRETLTQRVQHIVQSCFNGRRIVIFSGGETKTGDAVLTDARAIHAGGGFGSIIGRNCFQRPKGEALPLLQEMHRIYLSPLTGASS